MLPDIDDHADRQRTQLIITLRDIIDERDDLAATNKLLRRELDFYRALNGH